MYVHTVDVPLHPKNKEPNPLPSNDQGNVGLRLAWKCSSRAVKSISSVILIFFLFFFVCLAFICICGTQANLQEKFNHPHIIYLHICLTCPDEVILS